MENENVPSQIFFSGYPVLQIFYHNAEAAHDIKGSQK